MEGKIMFYNGDFKENSLEECRGKDGTSEFVEEERLLNDFPSLTSEMDVTEVCKKSFMNATQKDKETNGLSLRVQPEDFLIYHDIEIKSESPGCSELPRKGSIIQCQTISSN